MTSAETVKSYSITLDEKGQESLKSVFESLVEQAADGDIAPVAPAARPEAKETKSKKDRRTPSSRYTNNIHYWMQKNGAQLIVNEDQFAGVIKALRNHEDVPEILYGDQDAKIYDSDLICALRQVYRQPPPHRNRTTLKRKRKQTRKQTRA